MRSEGTGSQRWTPPQSFDEYRLVESIGSGGMGQVFLARDTLLDRLVAVKFISSVEPTADARERFLIEARAAARLQHPNVVTVHRVGELDGRPYIVSEFVRGQSLESLELPLPSRRVREIAIGLVRGLSAAHRRGVLHRDLKPANAILTANDTPKLLDFGLAKLVELSHGRESSRAPEDGPASDDDGATLPSVREGRLRIAIERAAEDPDTTLPTGSSVHDSGPLDGPGAERGLTRVGTLLGTPQYMPPELLGGQPATTRSDLYSLGVMLFELRAGRTPHDQDDVFLMLSAIRLTSAPPLLTIAPDTDPGLAAIIDRCLAHAPDDRFASADELLEALEDLEAAPRERRVPAGNPYRGLAPFEAEHRDLFFGRTTEMRQIVERLRAESLVLVAGDSGVGKSSLCRAGVARLVEDGALADGRRWSTAIVVPGRSPLATIGAALGVGAGSEASIDETLLDEPTELGRWIGRRQGKEAALLLLVDPLEELITQASSEDAARVGDLLAGLATASTSVKILATVRGDFLTRIASLPGLGEHVGRALFFLRPLTTAGIREAVIGPAEATGVRFETEALVDDLVETTAQAGSGGLPLLQFALAELWEAREPETQVISSSALTSIGGVAAALARHGDSALARLPVTHRPVARRLLMALVAPDGTRSRRTGPELGTDRLSVDTLDALVRARLVLAKDDIDAGTSYELAHETLASSWSTLRRWLDEQLEARAVHHRLMHSVAEWKRLGGVPEALWNQRQLAEIDVLDRDALGSEQRQFLRESARSARRARLRRIATWLAIPMAVLLVALAVEVRDAFVASRRVSVLLGQARVAIGAARRANARVRAARRETFDAFDRGDRATGEARWQRVLADTPGVDAAYIKATRALEDAQRVNTGGVEVRSRLAEVLLERARIAERDHRPAGEIVERLRATDDGGRRLARLSAPAQIKLSTEPPGASVTVQRYEGDVGQRRRLGSGRSIGTTPLTATLAPGSYVLVVDLPGRATVRDAVLLSARERFDRRLELPPRRQVPQGFVFVPAGRFLFGTTDDERLRRYFLEGEPPLHAAYTGPFLIARHETTYADWIAYLESVPASQRAARSPSPTASVGGGFVPSVLLKRDAGGTWEIVIRPRETTYRARAGEPLRYRGRTRRAAQDWLKMPVSGISWGQAEQYLAWLRASRRVPRARACDEMEWERAARGADGRDFPNGDVLAPEDANVDWTYRRTPEAFGPDQVGSFPESRSPFGLDDMVGNVMEWTTSHFDPDERVLRGGAYYYDAFSGRSQLRTVTEPSISDAAIGLRVCASWPQR